MNTCLREETLQAYLDGELATGLAEGARAHLTECFHCAGSAGAAEQVLACISQALNSRMAINVPTERLRTRIEGELRLAGGERPSGSQSLPRMMRAGLVAASAAAAAAAIVWITGVLIKPHNPARAGRVDSHPPATTPPGSRVNGKQDEPRGQELGRRRTAKVGRGSQAQLLVIAAPDRADLSADLSAAGLLFDAETTRHLEKAEVLLRSFDNASFAKSEEVAYERAESRQLLYSNILLRREAENEENAPARSLLGSLEPLLLDISNLPDNPRTDELLSVKERIRTSEIVATLQVYSTRLTSLN
jgi:hypothetical protein